MNSFRVTVASEWEEMLFIFPSVHVEIIFIIVSQSLRVNEKKIKRTF